MEDNKFKVMKRDIEILRELVIDFVPAEKLVDRILLLEQARTQYMNIPNAGLEMDDEDELTELDDSYEEFGSI